MPGLPELEIICIDVEKHERRPQREKLEPHVNPDVLECHGAPPCCDRAAYSRRADPLLCRGATDGPSFLSHWPRLLQCVRDQNIGPHRTDCRQHGSWRTGATFVANQRRFTWNVRYESQVRKRVYLTRFVRVGFSRPRCGTFSSDGCHCYRELEPKLL